MTEDKEKMKGKQKSTNARWPQIKRLMTSDIVEEVKQPKFLFTVDGIYTGKMIL